MGRLTAAREFFRAAGFVERGFMTVSDAPPSEFDDHRGYCRLLGHEVAFSYCRLAKEKLPCHKILDCWYERLPVEDYMNRHFTPEELENILERPPAKMATLIDLINKAKERTSSS